MNVFIKITILILLCFIGGHSVDVYAQEKTLADTTFVSKREDGRVLQQPWRHSSIDKIVAKKRVNKNPWTNTYDTFSFLEGQLMPNDDYPATVTIIAPYSDYFLTKSVGVFGQVGFRARAYNRQYNNVYVNGVLINDAERGIYSNMMLAGLNDVINNREGVSCFEYNNFGLSAIGGACNVDMRAGRSLAGHKVVLTGDYGNNLTRAMYTYSTGLMDNGWAVTAAASCSWANGGVVEGIYQNSLTYFLAAEKRINNRHSLSFATWGMPTERALQAAATEEAYWLAGSHYYNSNWGFWKSKKRSAVIVNSYEPSAVMTWDFRINDKIRLTTSLFGKYSKCSTTALGWNANTTDPRPDFYMNMPSAAYDVWDSSYTPTESEYNSFMNAYNHWTADKANRQINWDEIYSANDVSHQAGNGACYYMQRSHNDQLSLNISSVLNVDFQKNGKGVFGLNVGTTEGMHYKTMSDLLGADYMIDETSASVRQIKEGDVFGYNYDINVNKANIFYQHYISKGIVKICFGANMEATTMERYGNIANGKTVDYSKGSSGTAFFLGGGANMGILLPFNRYNTLSLGYGYENRAPLASNSFLAPRLRNEFVLGLTNEILQNAEASYKLTYGPVMAKVTGYYTLFNDVTEHRTYYNDNAARLEYTTITGFDKEHYGIEFALVYDITHSLSVNALASVGNAEYKGNALCCVIGETQDTCEPQTACVDGIKVGCTPLTALSLGADYNIKGWSFAANVNYYDNIYINSYIKEGIYNTSEQNKAKGGFIVNAAIGKNIILKGGKNLNINLNLYNILNNQTLVIGGYEHDYGDVNPYLYYVNAFNGYLNIGFCF